MPGALAGFGDGFGDGASYCTTAEIRFLAVDNKVIYQSKRGLFVGICIEKGATSFVGK